MDLNIAVVFLKDAYKMISHSGKGRLIFTRRRENSLWRLNIQSKPVSSSAHTLTSSTATLPTSSPILNHSNHLLRRWHNRLGHAIVATILKMVRDEAVIGLSIPSNAKLDFCSSCVKGKQHRLPFSVNKERRRASLPGVFFHSNISGPIQVSSLGGHRYFITFKDDHSGYRIAFLMKKKDEVFACIQRLYHHIRQATTQRLLKFRSDNGKEYTDHRVEEFFARKGVTQEFTIPYTPQQNSVAERDNRTIMEMVRCMLLDRNISNRFWGEALATALYTLNKVASRELQGLTPYELWFGEALDVRDLRTFGSIAYAHVPKKPRKKLDSKTKECIFLGYSGTSKGYRLWCPKKQGVILSRDVIFDEDSIDLSISLVHTPT